MELLLSPDVTKQSVTALKQQSLQVNYDQM